MGEIAEVEKRPKAEERNLNQYREGGASFFWNRTNVVRSLTP